MSRAIKSGVAEEALAVYARWWQLETWLRQLVNIELRALYGASWDAQLKSVAVARSKREMGAAYAASPDASNPIAFIDVTDLLDLISDHWDIFAPSLSPSKTAWSGRMEELRDLRHRIAHCRQPHSDDLRRVEQLLRDLESGTKRSIAAYNDPDVPEDRWNDPLVDAWWHGRHKTARRLLGHAEAKYETRFQLRYSVRPWFKGPVVDHISGLPGAVWEAQWTTSMTVMPDELWHYDYLDKYRHLIMNLLMPSPNFVRVTFAAIDDPLLIADAIGRIFDSILHVGERFTAPSLSDEWNEGWRGRGRYLELRAQVGTWLATYEPHLASRVTIFGA